LNTPVDTNVELVGNVDVIVAISADMTAAIYSKVPPPSANSVGTSFSTELATGADQSNCGTKEELRPSKSGPKN